MMALKNLPVFIKISTREIADLARIVGKNDIKKLNKDDIFSFSKDLSELAGIQWLNS